MSLVCAVDCFAAAAAKADAAVAAAAFRRWQRGINRTQTSAGGRAHRGNTCTVHFVIGELLTRTYKRVRAGDARWSIFRFEMLKKIRETFELFQDPFSRYFMKLFNFQLVT